MDERALGTWLSHLPGCPSYPGRAWPGEELTCDSLGLEECAGTCWENVSGMADGRKTAKMH
jgi:hypothetical protein